MDPKNQLRELFAGTLAGISLERVMPAKLRVCDGVLEAGGETVDLGDYKKTVVVAIGKAAFRMTEVFRQIVAPRDVSGVIVSSVEAPKVMPHFMAYRGGHPYPNEQSLHAAAVVHELAGDLEERHLVVYLLSGGGSAVFERPVSDAMTLDDVRGFFEVLVTCGANIVEMNVLRKHFSAVKGGRLAAAAHPARQLTLYVSDVPPGQASTVASGPTMPDESTVADCAEIAGRLNLLERFPRSVREMFERKTIPETPKPGSAVFSRSSYVCLADNQTALEALQRGAQERGWRTETDLSVDDLPVAEAAERLLERLARLKAGTPDRPAVMLTGGELSSPVTGDGQGGRNQAFVLDCVPRIAGRRIAVMSSGTDGIDGNSPAAGAVADGETLGRASGMGMSVEDFQKRSDSYRFFERLGDAIVTGPTENNVRDVRALLAW